MPQKGGKGGVFLLKVLISQRAALWRSYVNEHINQDRSQPVRISLIHQKSSLICCLSLFRINATEQMFESVNHWQGWHIGCEVREEKRREEKRREEKRREEKRREEKRREEKRREEKRREEKLFFLKYPLLSIVLSHLMISGKTYVYFWLWSFPSWRKMSLRHSYLSCSYNEI